jgi:Flp pilus assembly pilin Flp
MSKTNNNERGVATVEYGITIGAVALVAAAMFAQTSAGVTGVWKNATAAANKSAAAHSSGSGFTTSPDCMAGAHGDSKVCKEIKF